MGNSGGIVLKISYYLIIDLLKPKKQKLYCYVDETGQDTFGQLFLVSVVITGSERDDLRRQLRKIEKESGKKQKKWKSARPEQRRNYIQALLAIKKLTGHLYIAAYKDTKTYVDLTILSIAKSLHDFIEKPYEVTVLVDGLKQSERFRFAAGLQKLRVKVRKVRGLKDEADEFIRLADALAGFVRDAQEGDPVMKRLYNEALRKGLIKEA